MQFEGEVIRRVQRSGVNIIEVLNAFEEQGWPERVENPFPNDGANKKLQGTCSSLKDGLQRIRFYTQGGFIYWTLDSRVGPSANELGSISQWLIGLRDGDADAAAELWRRYFDRLTHLARRRLGSMPRRVVDEEDVALSAFDSFCRAAAAGRFPKLDDRDDLWQVLVLIAARKAASAGRQARRQKRGSGQVRGHSCFGQAIDGDEGWRALVADEPSPEVAAAVAEEYQRLMTDAGRRDAALHRPMEAGRIQQRRDRRAVGTADADRGTQTAPDPHALARIAAFAGSDVMDQGLSLRPLVIGSVVVDPPFLMAPLAGFTTYAFRQIVRRLGGCGLPVTEMVSARGFREMDLRKRQMPERLWGVQGRSHGRCRCRFGTTTPDCWPRWGIGCRTNSAPR